MCVRMWRQPGCEAPVRRPAQQLQQAGAARAQRQRRAHRAHQAQAEPAHRRGKYFTSQNLQFYLRETCFISIKCITSSATNIVFIIRLTKLFLSFSRI